MSDLATGLALVLVIEGLLWAGLPGMMRRAAAAALDLPNRPLRVGGLLAACIGVFLIWLMRG